MARMPKRRRASDETSAGGGRNTNSSDLHPEPKRTANSVSPAKNWSFTLNNHTEEQTQRVLEIMRKECGKWAMQEEKGSEGTPHLQGTLIFYKKNRPMSVFKDFKEIHWEVTRNVAAAFNYVQKEESRNGRRWTSWVTLEPPQVYGWQEKVVDMIPEMKPRNIYWFMEARGGIGKSTLVKNLCMTKEAMMVDGNAGDMKYAVQQWLEKKGEGPELIIVDLPRSKHHVSYPGWECILNGCFLSTKYEAGMVIVRNPIFIVFANRTPDYEEMSRDRWQVYEIEAEHQNLRRLD
jgi:hypothetical protein